MDTTYSFHHKEQYEGQLKTAMREDMNEAEGLKAYGVNLGANHMGCYLETGSVGLDNSESVKSWDVPLLEQMGSAAPMKCATAEAWDNEEFLFELRDGVAYCTLNRPAANNALNDGVTAGLHDSARILRNRPDIRIVVLTGNGRMFCAGGDPKSFQAAQAMAGAIGGGEDGGEPDNPSGVMITGMAKFVGGQGGNEASALSFARDLAEWASLPQFTICCMNGSAMGGGVGLICNCDMVVAVKSAHCTLSEVKLGVIPATISPHVIRTIGEANAKRLFSTAENCNMQAAMDFGLVQRVVSDVSEFPVVIAEMAKKIQNIASGALATTKQTLLNTLNEPTSQKMIGYVCNEYARVRKDKECEEGMNALTQKKKPMWVDRKIDVKQ